MTTYLVLMRGASSDGEFEGDPGWKEVDEFEAGSPESALSDARGDAKGGPVAEYVAIPTRSWRPKVWDVELVERWSWQDPREPDTKQMDMGDAS